jgi:murein hydrolase activator
MDVMSISRFILSVSCLFLAWVGIASASTQMQTRSQLEHLNAKIGTLKQKLDSSHHQQLNLEQSLAKTDLKMDKVVQKLHETSRDVSHTQQKIQGIEHHIQQSSQALQLQQTELAKQVRMLYMLGGNQPLKGILTVQGPDLIDRWLIFYQYVIHSRQHLMDGILTTQQALDKSRVVLRDELKERAKLHTRLNEQQSHLNQAKVKQTQIIEIITKTIKSDQQTLQDYERDKINLSALLQRLLAQSQVQSNEEKGRGIKKRIPSPIQGAYRAVKPWNQGLIFVAPEGVRVNAAQGGRVVFSDWLRGYGLLLILDHGGGWMSLYGYNESLYKHLGEWVNAGEQIATVGHSGGRREDGLYFEVRRMGRVVAAQRWLMTRLKDET